MKRPRPSRDVHHNPRPLKSPRRRHRQAPANPTHPSPVSVPSASPTPVPAPLPPRKPSTPLPPNITATLQGHAGRVNRVIAIPDHIVTLSIGSPRGVRSFDAASGAAAANFGPRAERASRGLAALGAGVFVAGSASGGLSTWLGATGTRLDTLSVDASCVTGIAAVGETLFVVGMQSGAVCFLEHRRGARLRKVATGSSVPGESVTDVAAAGRKVVTVSGKVKTVVWCAESYERLAVLHGHNDTITSVAICDRFIATSSADATIRVYSNCAPYPLVLFFEKNAAAAVTHVAFFGDLLLTASEDKTAFFFSLVSGKMLAHVLINFVVYDTTVLADGRIACVGKGGKAAVIAPPGEVADDVTKFAATVFHSPPAVSGAEAPATPIRDGARDSRLADVGAVTPPLFSAPGRVVDSAAVLPSSSRGSIVSDDSILLPSSRRRRRRTGVLEPQAPRPDTIAFSSSPLQASASTSVVGTSGDPPAPDVQTALPSSVLELQASTVALGNPLSPLAQLLAVDVELTNARATALKAANARVAALERSVSALAKSVKALNELASVNAEALAVAVESKEVDQVVAVRKAEVEAARKEAKQVATAWKAAAKALGEAVAEVEERKRN